jgi:hypothetical protein
MWKTIGCGLLKYPTISLERLKKTTKISFSISDLSPMMWNWGFPNCYILMFSSLLLEMQLDQLSNVYTGCGCIQVTHGYMFDNTHNSSSIIMILLYFMNSNLWQNYTENLELNNSKHSDIIKYKYTNQYNLITIKISSMPLNSWWNT